MEKRPKGIIKTINTRNRNVQNASSLDLSYLYQELSSDSEKDNKNSFFSVKSSKTMTNYCSNFSDLKIIKQFLLEKVLTEKTKNRNVLNKHHVKSSTEISENILNKIKEIKLKVLKQANLSADKLSKYQESLIRLFFFSNNSKEIVTLYNLNSTFQNSLKNYLKEQTIKYIISPFELKYKSKLEINSKRLIISKYQDKSLFSKLVLKCQICDGIAPYIVKENEISNNDYTVTFDNVLSWVTSKKNIVKNVYKFDLYRETGNNRRFYNKYWIYHEKTAFNYNSIDQPYQMPVLPFDVNDYFTISINLISSLGLINFESFKWNKIKLKQIEKKKKNKELSRLCEVELLKNSWQDLNEQMTPQIIFTQVEKIKKILKIYLKVIQIQWDNIGYFIIKVSCLGHTVGKVYYNNEVWIDVAYKQDLVCNEIKKNGLIYDNYEDNNGLQVRVGDEVILYFSISEPLKKDYGSV